MSDFAKVLQRAWDRRAGVRAETTAFRLLNGAASGTPDLIVDAFADCLVVYAYGKDLDERYGDFARLLAEVTGARAIALKDRSAKDEDGREGGSDLFGAIPETAEVAEGGLRFRVYPRHPRNVGLFLDTRMLRRKLARESEGRRVLNLFSYSCSLGVAAAFGKAEAVTNVDISARYLGWGKGNLALNALPAEKSRFTRMDSEKYLDWAAKKSLGFDIIILDPPSFSRSEDGVFSFAQDYFRLAEKAARLLGPGGRLCAMTNFGGISAERFRKRLSESLRAAGHASAGFERIALPQDFDGAQAGSDGAASGSAVEGTLLGFIASI